MTEANIMYDGGSHWVCRNKCDYTVYKVGLTHSVADSSYALTSDGLSIAIARCKYLARKTPGDIW
jgi:hypothetical protein